MSTYLSAEEALVNIESFKAIDVREEDEFELGHIKGAHNAPLSELEYLLNTLDKNSKLLIYCRSGKRSQLALKLLEEQNFKQLYHLDGGILSWVEHTKQNIIVK